MTDTICVPDAPQMAGLAFQPFRGSADLAGMVAVREACRVHDQIDPLSAVEGVPTLADLQRVMVPSEQFDPATDVLIVTMNDHIIGYGATTWWTEMDGTGLYLSLGWLMPEWRRLGIGTAMLHWAEAQSRLQAASHPTQGRTFFGANASETERDSAALLLNEGYQPAFTVIEMGMDSLLQSSEVALPLGFSTRPVQPSDLPTLFSSMNECYSDQGFSEVEDYQAWTDKQRDLTTWHVAWDAQTGEMAGQVQAAIYKGRGEVWEVSVRQPYRRKGLARALLVRGLHALQKQGITAARLHTVAQNVHQAWRLYESVGFRVLKRYPRYRKPMGA